MRPSNICPGLSLAEAMQWSTMVWMAHVPDLFPSLILFYATVGAHVNALLVKYSLSVTKSLICIAAIYASLYNSRSMPCSTLFSCIRGVSAMNMNHIYLPIRF